MADVFSKKKRSEVMSRIRSHRNKDTELALVKFFRQHKVTGWRRQMKLRIGELSVEGRRAAPRRGAGARWRNSQPTTQTRPQPAVRPDFVFLKSRTALFVDGCFWHGCPQHATRPKGNAAFWRRKFAANQARDRAANRALRRDGWRVVRIWEHTLRRATVKPESEARLLRRIQRILIRGKDF